jgi:hypothetical protein
MGKVRGKFLKRSQASSPSFLPSFLPSQRIRESEGKHTTHKRTNNSANHPRKHKLLRTAKSGVERRKRRAGFGGDGGGGDLGGDLGGSGSRRWGGSGLGNSGSRRWGGSGLGDSGSRRWGGSGLGDYGRYGRVKYGALSCYKGLGVSQISSCAIRCETRGRSGLERRRRAHTSQVRAISHMGSEIKRVKSRRGVDAQ